MKEPGISWVSTDAGEETGLEKSRIRIDMHHKGQPDDVRFFKELSTILDECNIEYLEYKVLSNNYMLFIGNGRQGVNGAPVTRSYVARFKISASKLIEQYGYEFKHNPSWSGFEVGLGNYSKLVKLKPIIVKDERRH